MLPNRRPVAAEGFSQRNCSADRLLRLIYWLIALLIFPSGLFAQDVITERPLSPQQAARTMAVPPGFRVSLFASEPDVQQPIGFCIDDRGRLWVAEAYNYPVHGTRPGDRIIILEDRDHDGQFDHRTVFYDRLNYVTGIEVGFGGAWIVSPPFLYFVPDRDADDKPDSEPVVLLDGFGNHANSHNLANGLAWGPDGWLYGTHGRTNWSLLGKPGTPDPQRTRFDGGVYRYHPVRHVWEPVADGSTNPWGIDWNDVGEAFVCNCVDPHLFHVIPGAHYEPWRNRESSQYAYRRIPSIADHLHFVGTKNVRDGLGSLGEDTAGGGHAHCGTMVYLGDNWPAEYRNTVFMHNIHGKRINHDLPRRKGSGYTASHGRDLMRAADPWFMGVTLQYGPDGAVYSSDWSDTGECHSIKNTQRQTGRIFKISYGQPEQPKLDLVHRSAEELVALHLHPNDWFVRHARRLLQERAAKGIDLSAAVTRLNRIAAEHEDITRRLRALWTLRAIDQLPEQQIWDLLSSPAPEIRVWAVRWICEGARPDGRLTSLLAEQEALLAKLAAAEPDAAVRLSLASGLQRLSFSHRWSIATGLLAHAEDADDANLPLMIWYGIEPLAPLDRARSLQLAHASRLPLVRAHLARRLVSLPDVDANLELVLGQTATAREEVADDLLTGLVEGLAGRRTVKMPTAWQGQFAAWQKSDRERLRQNAIQLALVFDDPQARQYLERLAEDRTEKAEHRRHAVQSLLDRRPPDLVPQLRTWSEDAVLSRIAIRGLAEYDRPDTAAWLLSRWSQFTAEEKRDAIQTLVSRPAWALSLLDAIDARQIPATEIDAFAARQLQSSGNKTVADRMAKLWGQVRQTPAARVKEIERLQSLLTSPVLAKGDRQNGRRLYQETCANCHRLFGTGGQIGPDLTGAQRQNTEYLLQNLIDPSSAVVREYQMQIVETTDGRTVSGLIVDQTAAALTLQTVNEKIVLPRSEIESQSVSPQSMMPDGLTARWSVEQIRDLIAYLSGPGQVELPEVKTSTTP